MSNILPYQQKNLVERSSKLRVVIVSIWALIFGALTLLLLMVPTIFVAMSQERLTVIAANRYEQDNNFPTTLNLATIENTIRELKSRLVSTSKQTPLQAIVFLRGITPSTISLDSFTLQDKEQQRYQIQGVAQTRAALQIYIRTLEGRAEISTVDAPIENFVKSTQAPFSITVTFKP